MFVTKKEFEEFKESYRERWNDMTSQIINGQCKVAQLEREIEAIKKTLGIKKSSSVLFTEWNLEPVSSPYTSESVDHLRELIWSMAECLGIRYEESHNVPSRFVKTNKTKKTK